jgi:hypothetical protein
MRLVTAFMLLALSLTPAFAQVSDPNASREAALAALSADLGKVQVRVQNYALMSTNESGWAKRINEVLQELARIRDAFKNNNYVSVDSFSVGLPMNISVTLKFKQ